MKFMPLRGAFAHLFALPVLISIIVLGIIALALGMSAFLVAALIVVLEVSLSFDNAVVNAKVLEKMSPVWQRRFLTWGIIFAVFVTRALLPIIIVALGAHASIIEISKAALYQPDYYAMLLEGARYTISAFGGIFLLLVALTYFIDDEKDVHWIRTVEKRLSRFGKLWYAELIVATIVLAACALILYDHKVEIVVSGIIGMVVFLLINAVSTRFSNNPASGGLALFIYLNVLDAAFSLDGVVGAFALSNQILVIVAGLGIGALFVRTLTVYLTRRRTLKELVYIEHGAHWAIFCLSIILLAGMFVHVPEPVTGLIGFAFLLLAYWSSRKLNKQNPRHV